MSIPKLTENLNIHQSLPDQPSLTSEELKQKWDEAPNRIKDYLNNILIDGVNELIESALSDVRGTMREISDKIYPIGRGFIDFTNTNYSNYLGFKWERTCMGMFPVGFKSGDSDFGTIGKRGGAKTQNVNLGIPLVPHVHRIRTRWIPVSQVVSGGKFNAMPSSCASPDSLSAGPVPFRDNGATQLTADETIRQTEPEGNGNTASFKVSTIPPFQVVNYWKRVS